MSRSGTYVTTAIRMALIEIARNRMALALVVLFIPTWITLAHLVFSAQPIGFRVRATGEVITAPANQAAQITGALNAVTLIVGFAMFATTFSSLAFDRRLVMAGYPRTFLLLAKGVVVVLASALIGVYATTVMGLFWRSESTTALWLGLFSAALTYGAIGMVLGSLLRTELAGMFTIIMISLVDLGLQSPLSNPAADSPSLRYLPSYGAVQASVSAGFADNPALGHIGLQLLWTAAWAVMCLVVFSWHTRDRRRARVSRSPLVVPSGGDGHRVAQ
ncbi:hypothetical protein ALI144C_07980 [Actinosynnema sp. ALI-1.44]|uniref:hypothetical protein n=1 Tax=Actinosynnema sp. ALI-1.44 TaxID=1933779 RepID=UPI00097C221E|nr:hypothetical protein [Actinosynnema sp. ALI-1.44]ONI87867.1 hypothetical protein ALI144C_07980 [Actinosynnema sp. ALI-1.44]